MKKIILAAALFAVLPAYAATCSSYEQDKANYFAEIQGREVVNQYQGGNNISTRVTSCDYNSYTGKYNIGIDVSWYGIISDKYYNSSGKMSMNSEGGQRHYSETYRNQNLKDYGFFRGLGMLALVAGAAGASAQQQRGDRIWVRNQCGREVKLMIYFKNVSNNKWEERNWWTFSNGESGFLTSNNTDLRTNNAVLYYAIKPSFTSLGLTYDSETEASDGLTYQFRKVVDTTGDTEINLCSN